MFDPDTCPTTDFLTPRASTTPERTAVVDVHHDREWTYRALDVLVDNVASRLVGLLAEEGVSWLDDGEPADTTAKSPPRIGCLLSNRLPFAALLHASMRIGATLVPMNTELSATSLTHRFDRVEPSLLVCERETAAAAREVAACPVVSVDQPDLDTVEPLFLEGSGAGTEPSEAASGDTDQHAQITPTTLDSEQTVLVLFTSGTTGEPKGVRITPRNLFASATASAFRLGVTPADRWLCCLPPYHMGGLAPVVRTAIYGTTLLVQREFDGSETAEALRRHKGTGISLVPTQLQRLLDDGWAPPEQLGTVLLGGAPASESLLERALEADVPVYPTYGMTETTSQVATARPSTVRTHPETVGQPLFCTTVTVLDEDEPVEPGAQGELVVDGPAVTPGYLDADRTQEAFCEHGLRTGDVGRLDKDGRLTVLGRLDDQIQTGGKLVAPAEVRAALLAHPAIDDAAVVGIEDREWGERVAALVTTVEDGTLSSQAIDSHCRAELASFKVPKSIVVADSLPRTPSGTVDRDATRAIISREE